jgi:hypothetical protein
MRIHLALVAACALSLAGWCTAQEAKDGKKLAEIAPKAEPVERPDPMKVKDSMRRGIDFLVKNQNKNGSFGSPELKGGIELYAPVPGAHHAFHAAVTAMCISALIETGMDREDVRTAVDRAEPWLIEYLPKVRRAEPQAIYNVWTHIYGIQALVRMHQRTKDADRRKKIIELIEGQIGFLQRYESVDKGWGYYDFDEGTQRPAASSTSFVTAAALVAFREAKDIGANVPDKLVEGAIKSIHRQRLADGSYLYGEYLKYVPQHPINRPGGSLGRSQACNLALRLWKDEAVTDAQMKAWLDRMFARNGWLDMGRTRPVPHESYFAVAGYFFFFGHYYTANLFDLLPANERPYYQDHLATVLMRVQGKDGTWWDYPLFNYHQYYGTAFALMSMKRCER